VRAGLAIAATVAVLSVAADAQAGVPTPPRFVPLSSTMVTSRFGAVAAATAGKVLVAGGSPNAGFGSDGTTALDRFDPNQGTTGGAFTALTATLDEFRYFPFAASLSGDKVLIGGGFNQTGADQPTAVLFDPATSAVTPTGNLTTAREGAWAAALPDGHALVGDGKAGASLIRTAEDYDPATGAFTTLLQQTEAAREFAAAAPLPGGKVLIAGGADAAINPIGSVEIFDPATGTFAEPAGGLVVPRSQAVAAALPDGKVLIAGGAGTSGNLRSAELFDPVTKISTELPESGSTELTVARDGASAAPLPGGRVLIAGGRNSSGVLNTAEVFESAPEATAPNADFASHTVGTTTAQTLTITNEGAQGLSIDGFATGGGNAGDFAVGQSTCPGTTVGFGQTCTVAIDFTPGATGARVGTLRLADNEPVPFTLILTGTGTAPTTTAPPPTPPPATSLPPAPSPVPRAHFTVLICHTSTRGHGRHRTISHRCTRKTSSGTFTIGAHAIRATLRRGSRVFATGKATTTGATRVDLIPKRTITKGSYTLRLTFVDPHTHRTRTSSRAVSVT
jgi:hypothetical protein